MFFSFSLLDHTEGSGPLTQGRIPSQQGLEATETRQRRCPPQGERHFCILLLPDKSMASGGTRPAGVAFKIKEEGQQIKHLLPQDS